MARRKVTKEESAAIDAIGRAPKVGEVWNVVPYGNLLIEDTAKDMGGWFDHLFVHCREVRHDKSGAWIRGRYLGLTLSHWKYSSRYHKHGCPARLVKGV
jgi:hypothetical protein